MFSVLLAAGLLAADPQPKTAREAFQPLNPLIGSWKGTGYPDGTREERQKGFWTEKIEWEWRFDKDDTRLAVTFEKGKHFTRWDLRYLPDRKLYQLSAVTPENEKLTFTGLLTTGKMKEQILTLERSDEFRKEDQRLVVTLLHHNRYLYRWEARPAGAGSYIRKYQVGATKEGEPFADLPQGPECIVSGGKGTIAVSHKGKTYHVCCSGCRDEFRADPEKYIKEYEAKPKGK
jgi:YHS domain-containing protein